MKTRRLYELGLSGKVITRTKFDTFDDVRTWVPQLPKRNIEGNQPIVDLVRAYARMRGVTPAQISLARMLGKWPNVVPIPGSKNKGRIIENLDATTVELTANAYGSRSAFPPTVHQMMHRVEDRWLYSILGGRLHI